MKVDDLLFFMIIHSQVINFLSQAAMLLLSFIGPNHRSGHSCTFISLLIKSNFNLHNYNNNIPGKSINSYSFVFYI